VNAAQSLDTIWVFGSIDINNQMVIDAKRILIVFGNARIHSYADQPLFLVRNHGILHLVGQGCQMRVRGDNGSFLQIETNGRAFVEHFDLLFSFQVIANVNEGTCKIVNVKTLVSSGTGNGTSAFFITNGSSLVLKNIASLNVQQANVFSSQNSSKVEIDNIQNIINPNGRLYLANLGTSNTFKMESSNALDLFATSSLTAIVENLNEGSININNSSLSTTTGKVVKTVGSLDISNSKLVTSDTTEAIRYIQSNANAPRIVNTTLVRAGTGNNLVFTPNTNDSDPLLLTGINSNQDLPSNPHIIEGYLLINLAIK